MDGVDEVRLATPGQVVTVKLDEGAGIGAWDIRAARHALAAVLRRRPEAYHGAPPPARRRRRGATATTTATARRPASIHETVRVKEAGPRGAPASTTTHERRSGLVRFLPMDATPEGLGRRGGHGAGRRRSTGAFDIVTLAPGSLVAGRDAAVSIGDVRGARPARRSDRGSAATAGTRR